MGDRDDDFNFDEDDLRFDDDDFGFENAESGLDDDSLFGDSEEDLDFGDDFGDDDYDDIEDLDLGDELDEDFFGDEGEREERGNRTFVMLAVAMIVLFVLGMAVVLFLALSGDDGDSPVAASQTAAVAFNNTQMAFGNETATAAIENETRVAAEAGTEQALAEQTATQQVFDATETANAAASLTAEAELNQTATQVAFNDSLTQTAVASLASPTPGISQEDLDATLTAVATMGTQGPPPTSDGVDPAEVALTATFIAQQLAGVTETVGTPGGGAVTPTREQVGPGVVLPTAIPNTGLFDDVSGGTASSFGMLVLAGLGLVGVIFFSRRMRAQTNSRD